MLHVLYVVLFKDKIQIKIVKHLIIQVIIQVISFNLQSLQDRYASRALRCAGKFVANPFHVGHKLFDTQTSAPKPNNHDNRFHLFATGTQTPTELNLYNPTSRNHFSYECKYTVDSIAS